MTVITTINIPLPAELKEFVDREAAKAGFPDPAAYIQALIRDDLNRKTSEEEIDDLEEKLRAGLDSGPAIDADDGYWERKRKELIGRHRQSNTP